MALTRIHIRSYQAGLKFVDGELVSVLTRGKYWLFDLLDRVRVDVVDMRDPWLKHKDLDLLVKSGLLDNQIRVLDLQDHERALIWIDGRFDRIVAGGLYALWTTQRQVRVEIVNANEVRVNRSDLSVLLKSPGARDFLGEYEINEDHRGVLYLDGQYADTLNAGCYLFWKNTRKVRIFQVNTGEQTLEISGQDIMTADKVTLRLNALVNYVVTDPVRYVAGAEDSKQSLYRAAQMALREMVGSRDLDSLLADKNALAGELTDQLQDRAGELGMRITSLGVRDIILPGEMKNLLNKVTEAKKAAEANLITRREETAAMRSQMNTAKMLENNPVLMRMRELEALEKIAANTKLNVVLGEKGLTDRVVNLL